MIPQEGQPGRFRRLRGPYDLRVEPNPWEREPYLIAEVGLNHAGDLGNALKAVEVAKAVGCSAIKFQTYRADEFCDPSVSYSYSSGGTQVTEPMIEMFRRYELEDDAWQQCVSYARTLEIDFLTTPQNASDLRHFDLSELPAIKVGSDDLTNFRHLAAVAETGRPLILSSGMARLAEVATALDVVGWPDRQDIAVLVCTSQYPTPARDANVRRVSTLKAAFPSLAVGFSDHTVGNAAAVAACALGASIFEKHFTTDRSLPGPDQWFSADPKSLRDWVTAISEGFEALGSGIVAPTPQEEEMAKVARRSLVALRDLSPGDALTESDVGVRRTGAGAGLPSAMLEFIVGLEIQEPVASFDPITWDIFVQRTKAADH